MLLYDHSIKERHIDKAAAFTAMYRDLSDFSSSAFNEHPPALEYGRFYGLTDIKIKHRIGTLSSGEFTLVAQGFYAIDAVASIVIIHGFMDHTGLYGKLIRYLLEQHYNVFMVDLPGHGLSSGTPASIDSFVDYSRAAQTLIDTVSTLDTPPLQCVIGQSMGGAIAMTLLKQRPQCYTHTILLAPLVQPML